MKVKTKLQGLSSFFRMILVLAALDVADWDDGDNLDDYYPNEGGNTSSMTFSTPDAYKEKNTYNAGIRTVPIAVETGRYTQ